MSLFGLGIGNFGNSPDALMAPYRSAIAEAGRRGFGDAMTASQSSGNPYLAMRSAAQAQQTAQAPLLAQAAAQQQQLQQQHADQEQHRFERFLGGVMSGASAGLGAILPGIGGQSQQPQAQGQPMQPAPQPMMQQPQAYPQGGPGQPNQLGTLLRGGQGIASMFPGYGNLIAGGLGGLGALIQ